MRRILVSAIVVLGAFTMAGCTAATSSDSGGAADYAGVPAPESEGVAGSLDEGDSSARQVITTGYVYITAESPTDAAASAITIVEGAGGRIDARQEYAPTDGDAGSATLTVRIPSASLTATLDEIKALGEVEQVSLQSDDVTRESQDLDARITASRTSIARLVTLLEKASTTTDLIELETAIADRQATLESMEAEKRLLDDQVAMSSIEVSFTSEAVAPVDTPDTFLSGIVTGWEAFVAFIGGLLVVVGVMIPWLAFTAVLAAIVVVIVRVVRVVRRRRKAPVTPADT